MNWLFTAGWIVWGIGFAVLEGIAIKRKAKGDTLSEHVWFIVRKTPLFRWLILAAMIWLTLHFTFLGKLDWPFP